MGKKNAIHFQLEDLKIAEDILPEISFDKITEYLGVGVRAKSHISAPLVRSGTHSFLYGMYEAYCHHRPFILSPDMIWLLISQGFAHHVNFNSEKLRTFFVDFKQKKSLSIQANDLLHNPENWENIPAELIAQMQPYLPNALMEVLTADFSETNKAAQIASQINILYGFKSYFEYEVIEPVCGIPAITLEGTPEDWQKMIKKTESLRKYKLDTWIDALLPILQELLNTANGLINKDFWRNIFKIPEQGVCNFKGEIDGWVLRFFPYFANGTPTNLTKLSNKAISDLPDEICRVPFKWEIQEFEKISVFSMEFAAGFVGLSQNPETKALRPEIGWFVAESHQKPKINLQNITKNTNVTLNLIEEIPEDLYQVKEMSNLTLYFTNKVHIPKKLLKIRLYSLNVNGDISPKERKRIIRMFPFTRLYLNGELVQKYLASDRFLPIFLFIIARFIWRVRNYFWWL